MTREALAQLKTLLAEIEDLKAAAYILSWDRATKMPEAAASRRARQIAVLEKLIHEKETAPALGNLLEKLAPLASGDDLDARLVRVALRDYQRAIREPASFTERFSEHCGNAYSAWVKARPNNDFAAVLPHLERGIELTREYASFFPEAEHPADPWIQWADHGLNASRVKALFADLRSQLVPLVQSILDRPAIDDSCLRQRFPEDRQIAFGEEVIRRIGYDFARGRQDKTHHPFMTRLGKDDVRITTRVDENFLGEALFSTIHEAGHALYELGTADELDGTPLAHGTSSGVHESQSRFWENFVGRSREFWEFFYPRLVDVFPDRLEKTRLDTFYRAINKVERSLIRTDADEVTYNLHVMIRFDLEMALIEGKLAVKDLPEAWNERYRSDLGITPPNDGMGCMQDVHWFAGPVAGVFHGYTIGNLLAAQLFEQALNERPSIPDEIRQGEFAPLLAWLRDKVHRHGRSRDMDEIVKDATDRALETGPLMRYLQRKYGEIYEL